MVLGLKELDALCIANASCSRMNSNTKEQMACIYITWRFLDRHKDISRLSQSDVREIYLDVFNHGNGDVTRNQIKKVTTNLTKPATFKTKGFWHKNHK